jgi:ABC-type microcin C transport system permease subunit YejB
MIKDVKAQADELIFVLKTAEPSQVNEIMHQLHKELTAILKKKRSTTVRGRAVQNVVTFTFSNLEHGGGIHPIDLEFLEEKYGLDQRQLRRLVNVINGE